MAPLARNDDDIDQHPPSHRGGRRQNDESASSYDWSQRGGQGRRRQQHRRPAPRPAVRAEMVHLIGRRPVVLPNDGARPEFADPLIPHPSGFHIVLTSQPTSTPTACSAPPTRSRQPRPPAPQTASAVAVVADTTPRAATAPSQALP